MYEKSDLLCLLVKSRLTLVIRSNNEVEKSTFNPEHKRRTSIYERRSGRKRREE